MEYSKEESEWEIVHCRNHIVEASRYQKLPFRKESVAIENFRLSCTTQVARNKTSYIPKYQ